jgi:formiminotetrahydrofolate cyclodeaminase
MDFLDEVAGAAPVPAGGAAAAYVANLAMALLHKVILVELNRKDLDPQRQPGLLIAQKEIDRMMGDLKRIRNEDPQCYVQFSRSVAAGDRAGVKSAFVDVITCSMLVIEKAQQGLEWVCRLARMSSSKLAPHLRVATELLSASAAATAHVVRENLMGMKSAEKKRRYLDNLESALEQTMGKKREVLDLLKESPGTP